MFGKTKQMANQSPLQSKIFSIWNQDCFQNVCLNVKSSPVHRDPTPVTDKTAGFKIPAKQNKK